MRKALLVLSALLVMTLLGVSSALAQQAAKETKKEPAAKEAAPAETPKAEAVKAETLAGTLQMVAADKKIVVVTDASGIPFNFKVTGATRIKVAGKKAKLDELASQTSKSVTVKFLPLRTGNAAQSIEVSQ